MFNFLPSGSPERKSTMWGRKWHSKEKLFSAEGCSASAVLKALIWRQFAATCSTGSLTAENVFIRANGYIITWTRELVWQQFGDSDLPLICCCLLPPNVQRRGRGNYHWPLLVLSLLREWRILSTIYWKYIRGELGKWASRGSEVAVKGKLLFIKKNILSPLRRINFKTFQNH